MGNKYKKVYTNCNLCSVCGGAIKVEEIFGGLFARIRCINYKDKCHGGHFRNIEKRRFTNWFLSSEIEKMISYWNWLNKI